MDGFARADVCEGVWIDIYTFITIFFLQLAISLCLILILVHLGVTDESSSSDFVAHARSLLHGATWLHASGSLIPLRSDGFLFESIRVPLLELRDQLLLLIIDCLLGELGLALKLLKLLISLTVLLLELF